MAEPKEALGAMAVEVAAEALVAVEVGVALEVDDGREGCGCEGYDCEGCGCEGCVREGGGCEGCDREAYGREGCGISTNSTYSNHSGYMQTSTGKESDCAECANAASANAGCANEPGTHS